MPRSEPPESDMDTPDSSPQKTSRVWLWVVVSVVVVLIVFGLVIAACFGAGVFLPLYLSARASATAAALAAPPADWQLVIEEPFDNNENNWQVGSIDEEWGTDTRQVERGHFIWEFYGERGYVDWELVPPLFQRFGDFYLTVEGRRVGGSPEDAVYGVAFRHDIYYNFAVFEINDYGYYAVLVLDDNNWTTIIPWTASEAIHYDGVNRLTVLAEGAHFYFFINGEFVGETDITSVDARGQIGLYIEAQEGRDGAVQFDNLAVYAPTTSAQIADTPTAQPVTITAQPITVTAQPVTATARADATATARANATAIAQVVATATAVAVGETAPPGWELVLAEPFDNNVNEWPVGSIEVGFGSVNREIVHGQYVFSNTGSRYLFAAPAEIRMLDDFYVTVEVSRALTPSYAGGPALVFRASDLENFAVFEIIDAGQFRIWVRTGGEYETLAGWLRSTAIHGEGDVNRLAVLAEGTHFSFFINNELVHEIDNDEIPVLGAVGVLVDVGPAQFDNFTIYAP